jgi:hypothetical protein
LAGGAAANHLPRYNNRHAGIFSTPGSSFLLVDIMFKDSIPRVQEPDVQAPVNDFDLPRDIACSMTYIVYSEATMNWK